MGSSLRVAAVAVLAALWGCFSAPSADVLFACDPEDAPACPPEYTCQPDGCCHRDGSDVEASAGACNSGGTSGFDPNASGTDTDPSTGADTDTDTGTDTGTDTDTDTGTDTGTSSSTAAETDPPESSSGGATSGRSLP